jgi:hypothetical protein
MTAFEITAKHNIICQPGRRVKILSYGGKENNVPYTKWVRWTVVKSYRDYVLMRSEKGYRECFSHFDIEQMIRKGEIK